MKSDFVIAVTQLAAERNLPKEIVMEAIEAALVSAYKRDDLIAGRNITVRLNPSTGEIKTYVLKTVVDEPADPQIEISLADAQKIKAEALLEDTVPIEFIPPNAGRIAAQTAKQVVLQRLREAERELVYEEYVESEGDVVSANILRMEPRQIIVDLGRAEALLPASEQVPQERYRIGQKMKVNILEVSRTSKGPQIITSRAHKDLLKRLFEIEVPEIYNGLVEITAAAREPGSRSKIAVWARQRGVDAVGSCVGLRGIRIQNIVNELQGEKIDVVLWDKDPATFLANALSPSQVLKVELNEEEKSALVVVPDRQLSLAIGREGQNARLAAKLTGWKVDIRSSAEAETERLLRVAESQGTTPTQMATATPEAPTKEEELEEAVEVPVAEVAVEVSEAVEVAEEVKEPGPSADEVPVLSPEEELATLSLDEEEEKPEPKVEEAISLEEVPEEVWAVPKTTPESSPLRFAEDIMGPRPGRGTRARRGAARGSSQGSQGSQGNQREEEVKARKGGGRRARVQSEDGDDPDGDV